MALAALPASRAAAQSDGSWVETERAARAALVARDTLGYRNELLLLCDQMNGNPRVVLRLARVEAALRHTSSACQWLGRYADMGLGVDFAADSLLAAATSDASCARTRERIQHNLTDPVDQATSVFTLPDRETIAEDLAYDSHAHRFFVSSVRMGRVLCFDRHGRPLRFPGPDADSLWSVMAVHADAERGRLWVTTACLPEGARWAPSDSGRTAVLCYALGNGRRLGRWEPPHDGRARVFGDMTVAPDGAAYISDSVQGAVYMIHDLTDSLQILVPDGVLRSPQTPAVTPDRTRLMIADYSLGIAVVDLSTRAVTWLGHRRDAALTGIDGLYFSGNSLIAIQNGTLPERLIKFELNETLTRVDNTQVLQQNTSSLGDPTHGVLVGEEFHFIANSGWNLVNESNPSGPMGAGLPPQIMSIHFSEGH